MPSVETVRTPTLEIACEAYGPRGGAPVILLHGFPDDARAYDAVAPPLAAAGHRVLVPYLRGYGPTRFLSDAEPRMAQQAAIGQDLLDLITALDLPPVALAGYDWGGRAACIAAILAPARVRALVTIGGYNVQDTLGPPRPADAIQERANWYQWYFNTERGRLGLEKNRREICRHALGGLVAGLALRRRDLRAHRAVLRQSGLRAHRDPLLSPPPSPRARRSALRRHRAPAGRAAADHRPVGDPPRRRGHRLARRVTGAAPQIFPPGTRRRVVAGAGHFMPREQPGAVVDALRSLVG